MTVADELRALGVRGILVTAAEQGKIPELKCQMPECLCPQELGGPGHFDPAPQSLPDWMPTQDHIHLKSAGGQLTVDNVRLAHRLCNRVDYAKNHEKPFEKDLARVEAARLKVVKRNAEPGVPRDERWPGRRDRILSHVADLWARWPDMRFGQLIENLLTHDAAVLFNLEDDEIEQLLLAALSQHDDIPTEP